MGVGELFSQTEQISLDYFDFRVQSIRLNYNLVMWNLFTVHLHFRGHDSTQNTFGSLH